MTKVSPSHGKGLGGSRQGSRRVADAADEDKALVTLETPKGKVKPLYRRSRIPLQGTRLVSAGDAAGATECLAALPGRLAPEQLAIATISSTPRRRNEGQLLLPCRAVLLPVSVRRLSRQPCSRAGAAGFGVLSPPRQPLG